MEATLVAEKRTDKGKNQARRHRAAGRLPAVVYGPGTGGTAEQAIPVTVDPKALSKILHSESGANTIISLQLDGASRARAGEGLPAAAGEPRAAARRLLPRRHGPQAHRQGAGDDHGRGQGRQAAGRRARLRHARVRDRSAAGRHPREHRSGRHRAAHEPGRTHPRRRAGRQVGAGERARDDARARRADARRGGPAATDAAAAPVAAAEPEVIKKGKTDKDEEKEKEKEKKG